ncbi:hypothetical protein, partial [Agrobacterium bohemicum]|uniref:hypothetical protein n=1 Tax=Agrobacterium bohemicum TaxID=2052828 RepID=UPI001AECB5F1
LGYTARRCGEAGPALVTGRLRILSVTGVRQQSPRRQREEEDTGFGPAGVILPMPDLAAS